MASPSKSRTNGYSRVDVEDMELETPHGAPKISGGEVGAGFFSRLVFWWVNPAIMEGSKMETVQTEQLWGLAGTEQLQNAQKSMHDAWLGVTEHLDKEDMTVDAAVAASGQGASMWNMPLARAFWRVHSRNYLFCCVIKYTNDFVQILPPILLNKILQFLTSEEEGDSIDGYYYVLAIFLTMSLKTVMENQYFFRMMRIAIQSKIATTGLVYRKALRLTVEAKSHHTEGALVNMMQQDSERLMWFIPQSPQLISGVLQISLNIGLLLYYVGVSVMPGVGILVMLVPMNRMLMRMQMKLRFAGQKKSDERIKLINEILKGIRVVKSYAWEDFLFNRVDEMRQAEISLIRTRAYVRAVSSVCLWAAPAFAVVATFSTYVFVGHTLDEDSLPVIFTAMMLFNNLRFPLMMYPMVLTQYGDTKVSLGRLQQYFARDEVSELAKPVTRDPSVAISVHGANFQWRAAPKSENGSAVGGGGGGKEGKGGAKRGVGSTPTGGGSTPTLGELLREQGPASLCACFQRSSTWSPRMVHTMSCGCLLPAIALLFFFSNTADGVALPGERILSLLAALVCVAVSVLTYLAKRTKMKVAAEEAKQKKQDAIKSVKTASKVDFSLCDLNFEIHTGELVMIVGSVGSGKSSLISALLGEMEHVSGGKPSFASNTRLSYVAQQAWLMNASLRDNITFISAYDPEKYQAVIKAAGLMQDLDELPDGDSTEIGERGINLSGGQKQRISIARAMYNEADVYVLDDPLSALDAHVGAHVFENVLDQLAREGKTVLLVTNQLQFVHRASRIIHLTHDKVTQQAWIRGIGTYDELLRDSSDEFTEMMKGVGAAAIGDHSPSPNARKAAEQNTSDDASAAAGKSDRIAPTQKVNAGKGGAGASLLDKEERESGRVSWGVYRGYFRLAQATAFFLGVLLLSVTAQLTSVFNDLWLTWWTQQKFPELPQWGYNGIYLLGAIGFSTFTFINGVFWANVGLRSAANIHEALLTTVLAAPVEFFDTTPVGRMLSRFSKDIQTIDDALPMQFDMVVRCSVILCLNFLVIGVITPVFPILVTPLLALYYYLQNMYTKAALNFKRLDSVSRSPVFNHFSETLGGLATIRAYGVRTQQEVKNMQLVDTNTRALFTQKMGERWLSLRLEAIGNGLVGLAGLLGVASRGDGTYAGFIGISLTYGMRVTGMLNWIVRSSTELSTQMNSTERILHYVDAVTPAEKPGMAEPPASWPSHGALSFQRYCMRYRPGLELVLRSIDCEIRAGEKVGICGRTGSGKSSLMLATLRMVEAASGRIEIDGINIATVPLKVLRSRISIIPQDPVLFSGTVRFNVDPTQQCTDAQVNSALDRVHLGEKVLSLDGGLDAMVSEYGDSFSVGQRQLLCMARALLRSTKVLLMDEATSSVDLDTDRRIQELIRTDFSERTILTIAHRINTVIDNDRILLIDAGEVAEFDTPRALLDDLNSQFSALVKNTGGESEAKLRQLAGAREQLNR